MVTRELSAATYMRVFPADIEVRSVSPTRVELTGLFLFSRSRAHALRDLARDTETIGEAIDATAERESDGVWRFITARHRRLTSSELLRRTGPH